MMSSSSGEDGLRRAQIGLMSLLPTCQPSGVRGGAWSILVSSQSPSKASDWASITGLIHGRYCQVREASFVVPGFHKRSKTGSANIAFLRREGKHFYISGGSTTDPIEGTLQCLGTGYQEAGQLALEA